MKIVKRRWGAELWIGVFEDVEKYRRKGMELHGSDADAYSCFCKRTSEIQSNYRRPQTEQSDFAILDILYIHLLDLFII